MVFPASNKTAHIVMAAKTIVVVARKEKSREHSHDRQVYICTYHDGVALILCSKWVAVRFRQVMIL